MNNDAMRLSAVSYSVDGRIHLINHMKCQDVSCIVKTGDCIVSVVADGAGGSPLGREAAELTADGAVSFFADNTAFTDSSVFKLKKAFLDHMDNIYGESGYEYGLLASTCLVVAVKDISYCVIHVGDGNILSCDNRFNIRPFSMAYNEGNNKNCTVFCNQYDEALDSMQIYRGCFDNDISAFLLLSDGASVIEQSDKLSELLALTVVSPNKAENVCKHIASETAINKTMDDVSMACVCMSDIVFFDEAVNLLSETGYTKYGKDRLLYHKDISTVLRILRNGDADIKQLCSSESHLLNKLVPLISSGLVHCVDGKFCLN